MVSKQVCLKSHIFNGIIILRTAKAVIECQNVNLCVRIVLWGLCNTDTAVAPLRHILFLLSLGCKTAG
jgi:hypothetical protein